MEDQPMLENTNPELLALSFAEEAFVSQPEQLSNECTSMIFASNDCQNINDMAPLNDLLLGPTFIVETNEQPLFVNNTQFITFQNIDATEQINDIQKITIDSEKTMIENIDFTIDPNDQFQDIYTNFDKTNLDSMGTPISNNLKEYLDILNNSNFNLSTEFNYNDSTAIQIIDDVSINPIDTSGHFVCDLCLCEFNNWQNYKKHKLEHLNDKPFKCSKCLESFNYNNNYLLHIASHSTDNLKCPECKKEFKRIASFKSHLKIHHTEESITCMICFKMFDNQYRMDIHKENCMQENILLDLDNLPEVTSATKLKICKICDKSFSVLSEYKMHIKEHKKFNSMLKKQSKFSMKLKNKHKNSNIIKRFKCDLCEWSFNKSILLNRHMRTHTGEKPFQCSYCSTYFTQENSLNRHMLKHKGLRPFICEFCEMDFSQKVHLINHVKKCHAVTKEATRIHTCCMCPCVYNNLQALNKHLNSYHKFKVIKSQSPSTDEMEDLDEDMKLINEKWLDAVVLEFHNDDDIIKAELCNDPISTKCDFEINLIENENFDQLEVFNEISNINTSNPVGIENSSFSPQNDENVFASKKKKEKSSTNFDNDIKKEETELEIKTDNVNGTILPDINEIFNKLPSKRKKSGDKISKKNLSKKTKEESDMGDKAEPKVLYVPNITTDLENINVNATQTQNSQPKICKHCGKIFKKNADLTRHVRVHTGDRPYKCDQQDCNKAFATKATLEYHKITHSGKMKRAECPQCKGLFATTSSMKVHMRQHTGEKPFKCPVCGDAFRTSGHLSTHVIIHERKKKRR